MFQVTVSSPVTQATLAFTSSGPHGTERRGDKNEQTYDIQIFGHRSSREKQFIPLSLLPESMLIGVEVEGQFPSL